MNAELSTGDVLLNLLLKNKEKLVKDIKGTAILPCRNHRIGALNPVRQSQKKITSLGFRKENFGLVRDLLGRLNGRLPWRVRGAQDLCCLVFIETQPPQSTETGTCRVEKNK